MLRTLGRAKRENPKDTESTTVMRILKDMNVSKLVDEDEPLFVSLINDLFPNMNVEKCSYKELEFHLKEILGEAGLVRDILTNSKPLLAPSGAQGVTIFIRS